MLNSDIHYVDNELFCESVSLRQIAERIGTPTYVYSYTHIDAKLARLQAAFPTALICFANKALRNVNVLGAMVNAGYGFDVTSGGELHCAMKAGGDPKKIVFAGAAKPDDELGFAIQHRIRVNAEAMEELVVLQRDVIDPGHPVSLRVRPDVLAHNHSQVATGHKGSKFGISIETCREILANPKEWDKLTIDGLQFHIGSQLENIERSEEALRNVLPIVKEFGLRILDIGGGFPVKYGREEDDEKLGTTPEQFAEMVYACLSDFGLRDIELIIEPGRYVAAEAGVLITQVQTSKRSGDKRVLTCNAGMSDLIRQPLYGAYHEIVPVTKNDGELFLQDVGGPNCESDDFLGYDRMLQELQRYDLLAVLNAGAYGFTMASNYCGSRRPAEVGVKGGMAFLIRPRETYDDLTRSEEELMRNPVFLV